MSGTTNSDKSDTNTPKRVLHFSDGILEDYENKEEDNPSNEVQSDKQIVLVRIN